jgi:uncharacterized protein (DUF1697 family)
MTSEVITGRERGTGDAGAPVTYVALLRGINVGGRSIVDMRRLKQTFERLGFDGVRTYINSGNVVFSVPAARNAELMALVETAIAEDFGLSVPVLVLTAAQLAAIADSVPAEWVNDASMKCDVFFLWPEVDRPSVLDDVPHKPSIEDVRYVPGAFVRRIDRKSITRSPLTKIAGTDLYRRTTVRNINTVRKLRELSAS